MTVYSGKSRHKRDNPSGDAPVYGLMAVLSSAHPVLLVVDDDERLRELVKFAALRSGEFASVQLASDGSEALARLHVADGAAAAIAKPHSDWPVAGFGAMLVAK